MMLDYSTMSFDFFKDCDLLNAFGIIFTQHWMQPNCEEAFWLVHLEVIKKAFCKSREIDVGEVIPEMKQVTELLNTQELDSSLGMFKLSMVTHSPKAMEITDSLINPMTRLWTLNNSQLCIKLFLSGLNWQN